MAWTADNLYNYYKFLINKHQIGDFSPTNFFYAFNSEQRSYMNDLLGRFQSRSNGKGGPNTGLILNKTIIGSLSPFIKSQPLVTGAGQASKPLDYVTGIALRANGARVYPINQGQIAAVNKSVVDAPSIADNVYYYCEYDTYFLILPSATPSITLDYVRTCPDVKWDYTLDGNNLPQYNAGASVQPLWSDLDMVEIVKRSMSSLGVHFNSGEFLQYGTTAINTGN
jgi:hypothetical protein